MKNIFIKDIKKLKENSNIEIFGWILDFRDLKKNKFIILRDSTGSIQGIIKDEKLFDKFKELSLESVLAVKGKIKKADVKSELVSIKDKEIEIKEINILNKAEILPIPIKDKIETNLQKRIDYRYLDVRKRDVMAIFKIQSCIINYFRNFFFKRNFIEIQPPSIIAAASEGGTELFPVSYFENKAFLAQSPQLYKQLMAISLEKVFCTTPVWRAEKHNTIRHLNEVRQMDIEVAFANDFDVMKLLEDCIKYIIKEIKKNCKEELEILNKKIKVPKAIYISYDETIKILNENGIKINYGEDLTNEAEKKLSEIYKDSIIFVHSWPISLKPFYIMPKNEKLSCGFDAILNGLEISSGGQRIHIANLLKERIKINGLNEKNFEFYINSFKYGAPPHSGWSIGLERLTMAILNLNNIREACLFPRDRDRLVP
ncbi:MAG: aspartate--tRNA(Asn) ligase [Candidatus Pacearchaeota archaeon]